MAKLHKYTDEQDEWIIENSGIAIDKLAEQFNEKFNVNISWVALKSHCKREGISFTNKRRFKYTQEQTDWLMQNRRNQYIVDLVDQFNEEFGANVTKSALYSYCARLGVFFEKDGKRVTRVQHPIGHERKTFKHYIIVKVADPDVWEYKHKVVYEQNFGPVPDNHVVIFKDSDRLNFDPDNLVAISKSEHTRLNANSYSKQHDEIKPAILNLVRLNHAIKGMSK
jgi:hypothetical protein